MKPFKINRNSWHYKMNKNFLNADSMEYTWESKHNNFCSYWRATILRMLCTLVVGLLLASTFTMLGYLVYAQPLAFLIAIGFVVGLLGIVAAVHFFSNRKYVKADKPDSLFMQKYKAHKLKICPMVEYDE